MDTEHRAYAEIDLSALEHNYRLVQKSGGRPVMCVLKANAYGHGALPIAAHLVGLGAEHFAVACLEEAALLRSGGLQTETLLILGHTPPEYAGELSRLRLSQTVPDLEAAVALNDAAVCAGVRLPVHIKVDTGMTRLGLNAVSEERLPMTAEEIIRICALSHLIVEGMYTHFVSSDRPDLPVTDRQRSLFLCLVGQLEAAGINIPVKHAANSAGAFYTSQIGFDMVRAGAALYGIYPDSRPRMGEDAVLRPVMTLRSSIVQIKEAAAGQGVSYGHTYVTQSPRKLAVIAAGYADGFPRRLSNVGRVFIHGVPCPIVGNICMDMFMADITHVSGVRRGDTVTLFGQGGDSLERISELVGTLNYELCCLVTPRARRVYVSGAG